jgi:TolA-binding protein
MCGGNLIADTNSNTAMCESCGIEQTLPTAADEQKAGLFIRANHLRRSNDFDRAMTAYENLLNLDDHDAEAHWGLLLSRYGIEYVDDPRTGEKIATCHRVQRESILSDPDYKAAIEYAPDSESRRLYEVEAKRIAQVQRDILAVSAQEEPYDVFICYKETTDAGTRSRDSVLAQDIYYSLTKEGYKVFFSRITLESKLGQQYEPYIFAALQSAKVMLVIGTKPEHFQAVWVKNEWSRYLSLMKKDRSKLLIPSYQGMDPYDLPQEMSMLQSLDMSRIGFIRDLLQGVERNIRVAIPKAVEPVAQEVATPTVSAESLHKRACIFLEDSDWKQADEYFDRILDQDPEYAPAYMGKLCAELCVHKEADLGKLKFSIAEKGNYVKALRFADERQRETYKGYEQAILDYFEREKQEILRREEVARKERERREEAARLERERKQREEEVAEEKRLLERYQNACNLGKAAKSISDLEEVVRLFTLLGNFQNSRELERHYNKIIKQKTERKNRNIAKAVGVLIIIVVVIYFAKNTVIPYMRYSNAERLMKKGDYDGAYAAFDALGNYKDSSNRASKAELALRYSKAEFFMEQEDYERAYTQFNQLGSYKDSGDRASEAKYKYAENCLEKGNYERAHNLFNTLGTYRDSRHKAVEAETALNYSNADKWMKSGDYERAYNVFVALGTYKDSRTKATEAKLALNYNNAEILLKSGEYEESYLAFSALKTYKDSQDNAREAMYRNAEQLMKLGDYEGAHDKYMALGNYKDSNFKAAEAKLKQENFIKLQNASVGDIVPFGQYDWLVLEKKNDNILLITKNIILPRTYNPNRTTWEYSTLTWEYSSLRIWLNTTFYNEFYDSEQDMIINTKNLNNNNPKFKTNGGKPTIDKIFLLSIDEANQYFKTNADRIAKWKNYPDRWWLRSPGKGEIYAAIVESNGIIAIEGIYVDANNSDSGVRPGVRPALWLSLKDGNYKQATVMSNSLNNDDILSVSTEKTMQRTGKTWKDKAKILKSAKPGDIVPFGKYDWTVLGKKNENLLLITKDIIEEHEYTDQRTIATWENSTLRKWLNSTFYDRFDISEKDVISDAGTMNNNSNVSNNKSVIDKIFLLSLEEANQYFKSDMERSSLLWFKPYWWWLRSKEPARNTADIVLSDGVVMRDDVTQPGVNMAGGVRPALWINLKEIDDKNTSHVSSIPNVNTYSSIKNSNINNALQQQNLKYLMTPGTIKKLRRYYIIRSKLSGYYFDIDMSGMREGDHLIIWHINGNECQHFEMVEVAENSDGLLFTIKPRHSGLYLGASGKQEKGSRIVQLNSETYWYIKQDKDGWYKIIHAPTNLVIEIEGESIGGDSKITLQPDRDNNDGQKFTLIPIG